MTQSRLVSQGQSGQGFLSSGLVRQSRKGQTSQGPVWRIEACQSRQVVSIRGEDRLAAVRRVSSAEASYGWFLIGVDRCVKAVTERQRQVSCVCIWHGVASQLRLVMSGPVGAMHGRIGKLVPGEQSRVGISQGSRVESCSVMSSHVVARSGSRG